jgi:hypothetical protein
MRSNVSLLVGKLAIMGSLLILACSPPILVPPSAPPTATPTPIPTPAPLGLAQWARGPIAPSATSTFSAIARDGAGNLFAVGYVAGNSTVNFGNSVTVTGASAGNNLLLVEYDQTGSAKWAKSVVSLSSGGLLSSSFNAVACDSSGNIYAAGTIDKGITFNLGNNVAVVDSSSGAAANSMLLVKYGSDGTPQWGRTMQASPGNSPVSCLAVDNTGNVYVAGTLDSVGTSGKTYNLGNSVTVNPANIPGTSSTFFIAKYDGSGNPLWANVCLASANGFSMNMGVATDSSGNVYCAGHLNGISTYSFGNNVTTTVSYDNDGWIPLVVKYDPTGNAQWARSGVITGTDDCGLYSIAVSSLGAVYAGGLIYDTVNCNFGNGVTCTGSASGDESPLLVKYDTNGNAQWARTTVSGSGQCNGLQCDSSGNVFMAGNIYTAANFGNSIVLSDLVNPDHSLVAKYDSLGNAIFATTMNNSGSGNFTSCVADNAGGVYAVGYIVKTGTIDFGNSVLLNSSSFQTACVVKYQ